MIQDIWDINRLRIIKAIIKEVQIMNKGIKQNGGETRAIDSIDGIRLIIQYLLIAKYQI